MGCALIGVGRAMLRRLPLMISVGPFRFPRLTLSTSISAAQDAGFQFLLAGGTNAGFSIEER